MKGKFLSLAIVFIMVFAVFGAVAEVDEVSVEKKIIKEENDLDIIQNSLADRDIEDLCGFVVPDEWWKDVKFYLQGPLSTHPSNYDWRDYGGVTPVKDQADCGSCWAFGTVAPLESAIKINEGLTVDLSEQWLVSCNREGWGCNGGWWAHDYHQWKTGSCGGFGAVLEDDFDYSASDESCGGPYDHPYIIEDWAFVGSKDGVAQTSAIKQAILDYGPVSAAVRATNDWIGYDGGVYGKHSAGGVNHAITIIGWDDSKGSDGAWIIKNSWGNGWGTKAGYDGPGAEKGYMWIEYGCSSVGYAACFVNGYRGPPAETDEKVTFIFDEITNDPDKGDYDAIDGTNLLPGTPEWYYRLGATVSGETIYQYNYNVDPDGWWIFKWYSGYTWSPQENHLFTTDSSTIDFTLKVMDDDVWPNPDDLADISAYSGGGWDQDTPDNRASIYHGTYNLITGKITGDTVSEPDSQGYISTEGDNINTATVWFKITDTYNEDLYEPDLSVSTSSLDFGEVKKGDSPSKSFTIENLADFDENQWQKLDWEATDDKSWISLSKTSGSLNGGQSNTVTVTINTNSLEKGEDYSGTIDIDSNDDSDSIDVSIRIKKSISKEKNPFINLLKDFYLKYLDFLRLILGPINLL